MRKSILIVLLLLSLAVNIYQYMVMYRMFVGGLKVEHLHEMPDYSDREKELIEKAIPSLLEYTDYPHSLFISWIEETDNEIGLGLSSIGILSSFHISIKGMPPYGLIKDYSDHHAGAHCLVFDKEMNLKRVKRLWQEDIVVDAGD